MATINHPSMQRAGGSSALPKTEKKSPQTYVVEDATQDLDKHLEQFGAPQSESLNQRPLMPSNESLERAREASVYKEPKDPVKEEEKKKLENILFMGKLSKVLEIAGHKFEISTLTIREQNNIAKEMMNFSGGADLFNIKPMTLANALKTIDGVKLDDLNVFSEEEEKEFKSKYLRRVEIIDNMQLAVIEKIYDEYNKLLKESDDLIASNAIKK